MTGYMIIYNNEILLWSKINEWVKGDSNPNVKYILSEWALWPLNVDTSVTKIGWKMGKLWAFKEFNMFNIKPPFWIFN